MKPNYWNEADELKLKRMAAAGASTAEIAIALNRSPDAIKSRAQILEISLRKPLVRVTGVGRCKRACAGGNDCCLRGEVWHEWHVCSDSTCPCHSQYRHKRMETQPVDTTAQMCQNEGME